MADKKIKVTLVKSVIGTKGQSHRATVRGLGLRRLNHSGRTGGYPGCAG